MTLEPGSTNVTGFCSLVAGSNDNKEKIKAASLGPQKCTGKLQANSGFYRDVDSKVAL